MMLCAPLLQCVGNPAVIDLHRWFFGTRRLESEKHASEVKTLKKQGVSAVSLRLSSDDCTATFAVFWGIIGARTFTRTAVSFVAEES